MKIARWALCCLPLLGQTPPVSSVTKSPGDEVTLTISANSQPGQEPVSLEWEVVFPAQLLQPRGDPQPGAAAVSAHKTLQCAAPRPYIYTCTLSTGQTPVKNGEIAIFHFVVAADAKPATVSFRIGNVKGTWPDSRRLPLRDTRSDVVITTARKP